MRNLLFILKTAFSIFLFAVSSSLATRFLISALFLFLCHSTLVKAMDILVLMFMVDVSAAHRWYAWRSLMYSASSSWFNSTNLRWQDSSCLFMISLFSWNHVIAISLAMASRSAFILSWSSFLKTLDIWGSEQVMTGCRFRGTMFLSMYSKFWPYLIWRSWSLDAALLYFAISTENSSIPMSESKSMSMGIGCRALFLSALLGFGAAPCSAWCSISAKPANLSNRANGSSWTS